MADRSASVHFSLMRPHCANFHISLLTVRPIPDSSLFYSFPCGHVSTIAFRPRRCSMPPDPAYTAHTERNPGVRNECPPPPRRIECSCTTPDPRAPLAETTSPGFQLFKFKFSKKKKKFVTLALIFSIAVSYYIYITMAPVLHYLPPCATCVLNSPLTRAAGTQHDSQRTIDRPRPCPARTAGTGASVAATPTPAARGSRSSTTG